MGLSSLHDLKTKLAALKEKKNKYKNESDPQKRQKYKEKLKKCKDKIAVLKASIRSEEMQDKNNNDSIKRQRDDKNSDGLENESSDEIKVSKRAKTGPLYQRVTFPIRRILAPMVGGSELAFRTLCRRYGTDLCYTPMMNSEKFATDADYRSEQFETNKFDRPLVAHFSANDPDVMLKACKYVEDKCDAVDLNLGCPQRIAHSGHFGSYLLGKEDRDTVLEIVRTVAKNLKIPIFCKIRLLDTLEETIELAKQLEDAGCSLLAIHARYRVNLVGRSGPGARDGLAQLDQVKAIKRILSIPVISNGNVRTGEDVEKNRIFTGADGVMTAEGILDDPAIFVRKSTKQKENFKELRKLQKKLREIVKLEEKYMKSDVADSIRSMSEEEKVKVSKKSVIEMKMDALSDVVVIDSDSNASALKSTLDMAIEYLDLVDQHPVKLKSVIFHIRRMIKKELTEYQLMEECVTSSDIATVRKIVEQCISYRDQGNYVYDPLKEEKMKKAIQRKKWEEGKRKRFESRMVRKAKREGREESFYINQGITPPSVEELVELRQQSKDHQFKLWKEKHSQHCFNFHLGNPKCDRDRACAFLHSDAIGAGERGSDPSWLEENNV